MAGKGKVSVEAQDDKGRLIGTMFMEVDDTSDDNLSRCAIIKAI